MKKLHLYILFISIISFASCSSQKKFIAVSSTYSKWYGGQKGVKGTNFVFKILNKSNSLTKVDSIKVDNYKFVRWEEKHSLDTLIILASMKPSRNELFKLLKNGKTSKNNSKKTNSNYKKANLYFSTDTNKLITISFNEIMKEETKYYQ